MADLSGYSTEELIQIKKIRSENRADIPTSDSSTAAPGFIERNAVPFGAIAGTGVGMMAGAPILGGATGTAVGKYVEQKAKQARTGKRLPFGKVVGGQAAAVGTDLALGYTGNKLFQGAKAVKRALPFMKAKKAAEAGSKVHGQFENLYGKATSEFGGQLDELGVRIPSNQVMDVVTDPSTDPLLGNQIRRALINHDAEFGTDLVRLLDEVPESFSATEAQQVSNALSEAHPFASKGLRRSMMQAVPEEMSGIRSGFKQSLEDIDVMKPVMGNSPFEISKRVTRGTRDPNFMSALERSMPESTSTVRGLSTAQKFREFPAKTRKLVRQYLPWILAEEVIRRKF